MKGSINGSKENAGLLGQKRPGFLSQIYWLSSDPLVKPHT